MRSRPTSMTDVGRRGDSGFLPGPEIVASGYRSSESRRTIILPVLAPSIMEMKASGA